MPNGYPPPTFESRIVRQSREWRDGKGNVHFEHNTRLEIGDAVVLENGENPLPIVGTRRNSLNRQELVTVLVTYGDGRQERVEVPASKVHRINVIRQ